MRTIMRPKWILNVYVCIMIRCLCIYILLGNLYVLEQVTAFLLHLACSNTLNVLYLYI